MLGIADLMRMERKMRSLKSERLRRRGMRMVLRWLLLQRRRSWYSSATSLSGKLPKSETTTD